MPFSARRLKKLDPGLAQPIGNGDVIDPNLKEGVKVNHSRFGRGEVLKIEGQGNDRKAEIRFDKGVKKLLLRFAKLEVLQ